MEEDFLEYEGNEVSNSYWVPTNLQYRDTLEMGLRRCPTYRKFWKEDAAMFFICTVESNSPPKPA